MKELPSVSILKQKLEYNPNTGVFLRILKTGEKKLAGRIHHSGYMEIRINSVSYMAHRIAWMLHTGKDPGDLQIDHKNRIKHDNRIDNLRLATQSQNSCNRTVSKSNTSGVKGVDLYKGKWRSRLRMDNKRITIGFYSSIEEAEKALTKARKETHKEFTCIN